MIWLWKKQQFNKTGQFNWEIVYIELSLLKGQML